MDKNQDHGCEDCGCPEYHHSSSDCRTYLLTEMNRLERDLDIARSRICRARRIFNTAPMMTMEQFAKDVSEWEAKPSLPCGCRERVEKLEAAVKLWADEIWNNGWATISINRTLLRAWTQYCKVGKP